MQTQSWGQEMRLQMVCAMGSLARSAVLFSWRDLRQLLCHFALELDKIEKGTRKTVPWRDDSVNPLTALLKWKENLLCVLARGA